MFFYANMRKEEFSSFSLMFRGMTFSSQKGEKIMFLSVFKEKTLNERLERFFSKVESGKLKGGLHEKTVWEFDAIEMKIEETSQDIRCYFNIDHRAIYIFHYMKEIGESKMVVEREEYLHENGFLNAEVLKTKILSFIERSHVKNPC